MNLISTSLLYSALMLLALVVAVGWHVMHPLRCHSCHTTGRVARDLGPVPLCLDCFVEQLAPSPATLEMYDPEAKIPTEVIASRRGGLVMKRLHRWQRMIRWHLNMAWTRHQFAESDEVLLMMRTAAFHQALAALDHQRETKHLPATQEQVDRLAQLAAERYLAGRMWRSKRLRRLAGRAAPDIFRNSFRETLLPKTDSFFHHGGSC